MNKFLLLALASSFAISALAHHSRAHYGAEIVEMAAEIVQVDWRNPHVTFTMRVTNEAGQEELWELEAGSTYMLDRYEGVGRELFSLGDRVHIAGAISSLHPNQMLISNMLLPDGTEAVMLPNRPKLWAGGYQGRETTVLTDNPERSLFRVWSLVDGDPNATGAVPGLAIPPLTPAGQQLYSDYDAERDNPDLDCVPPGMPSAMFGPHPIEFVDDGDHITLHVQENDIVRTIWVGGNAEAAAAPPSPLGYSVGQWEDSTLVVRTTGIDWPYFNGTGVPLSSDAVVVERFEISADGSYLTMSTETTDPEYLAEGFFLAHPRYALLGEELEEFNCVPR